MSILPFKLDIASNQNNNAVDLQLADKLNIFIEQLTNITI